jgi:hypothetical protein
MRRVIPRWRKATWALVLWTLFILIWAVAGGGAAADECSREADQLSRDACEAGAGIGVAIIFLIGFFGFLFFSLIWFMSRPKTRTCPRCGDDVRKGRMQCPSCAFDFRTIGQASTGTPSGVTPGA